MLVAVVGTEGWIAAPFEPSLEVVEGSTASTSAAKHIAAADAVVGTVHIDVPAVEPGPAHTGLGTSDIHFALVLPALAHCWNTVSEDARHFRDSS